MEVIGVSGSTKCDWVIMEGTEILSRFSTRGINPIFHSDEVITAILQSSADLTDHARKVSAVFVYSAGCSNKARQHTVRSGLYNVFPKAHHYVNHDIVGSALAVYQGVPCISAILGTGSNACFFDGDVVIQDVPSLDYILGDEGSGAWFGKKLLKLHLYKQLPEELSLAFDKHYEQGLESILENVYMKPYANVYLASFMSFMEENHEHPFIHELLIEGFTLFLENYILTIKNHNHYITHFTGSVAFHHRDLLTELSHAMGIETGEFIKEPIDRLVKYHLNKYYNQA